MHEMHNIIHPVGIDEVHGYLLNPLADMCAFDSHMCAFSYSTTGSEEMPQCDIVIMTHHVNWQIQGLEKGIETTLGQW